MAKRSNGEGTIVKTKNKGFRAVITIGRDINGKLKRKSFYAKTQKEALAKKNEFLEKNRNINIHIRGGISTDMPFSDWYYTWLFSYKKNTVKSSTFERYFSVYSNYIQDKAIGKIKLHKLSSLDLQQYYNSLDISNNMKHVINDYIGYSLTKANEIGLLKIIPTKSVELPKSIEDTRDIKYFTEEMQIKFFNHIKKEAEQDEDKKRYYHLYTVAFGTGMRLGELLGLKWQDFNMEDKTLTINRSIRRVTEINESGKGKSVIKELLPKTVKSKRIIPLCDKAYEALINQKTLIEKNKEVLTPLDMYNNLDLIFPTKTGNYTDPRDLTRSFKSLLKRAGIDDINFHSIRHTFATRLFENEVDLKKVQKLLGHSKLETTADIYTHVSNESLKKSVNKMNDYLL